MSTQQQNPPSSKKSGRKPRNSHPGNDAGHVIAMSDNDLSHGPPHQVNQREHTGNHGEVRRQKQGRKSHYSRKNGAASDSNHDYHTSAAPPSRPVKTQATPIKQAYAGPTFHQSPAPSSLPLPSFYSKSVPNAAPEVAMRAGETETETETEAIPSTEDANTASTLDPKDTATKRESTPLDWIFDAARRARTTPRAESPVTRSLTGTPAAESPAPRDDVFPFELENGSGAPLDGPSSFTPSYQERIEAARSTRSTSTGSKTLNDKERKDKGEALKQFLLKSQNKVSSLEGIQAAERDNPFNARPAQVNNNFDVYGPPLRQRSSSSIPSNGPENHNYGGYPQCPPMPQPPRNINFYTSPNRPPSSNLRNVYGPMPEPEPAELSSDFDIQMPRISTVRRPHLPQQSLSYDQPRQQGPSSNGPPVSTRRQKPSAQQMEDDLRRVLKLDVVSNG